ncbi:MAG: hypothetical protein EOP82_16490, partial [Variovorax sp.]
MDFDTPFPYDRVGDPSNAGRTGARFLNEQPAQWLTQESEDGVFAYKQGQFLNVESEAQALNGFYSLGREGAATVVRGSPTARGSFGLSGPAPASGVSIPQLFPIGDGSAVTFGSLVSAGTVVDEFGGSARQFAMNMYRTRNGSAVDLIGVIGIIEAEVNPVIGGGGVGGHAYFQPGAIKDGRADFALARDFMTDEGVYSVDFVRSDATGFFT